jgi:hypothetical protein
MELFLTAEEGIRRIRAVVEEGSEEEGEDHVDRRGWEPRGRLGRDESGFGLHKRPFGAGLSRIPPAPRFDKVRPITGVTTLTWTVFCFGTSLTLVCLGTADT